MGKTNNYRHLSVQSYSIFIMHEARNEKKIKQNARQMAFDRRHRQNQRHWILHLIYFSKQTMYLV